MAKKTLQEIKREVNGEAFQLFGKSLEELNNCEKLWLNFNALEEKVSLLYEFNKLTCDDVKDLTDIVDNLINDSMTEN